MITAMIGPAGSGKTTWLKMLKTATIVTADELVKEAYKEDKTLDFFEQHNELRKALKYGSVNKDILITLLDDKIIKKELEDHLFNNYLLPIITEHRQNECPLIVDGVLSRYLEYFDQVIYVEMRKEDRIKNLKTRGVNEQRIKDILKLQENMFPCFKFFGE